jgi:hypothetical protein
MGVNFKTLFCHYIGKAGVTTGMFNKAVADHQHAARHVFGGHVAIGNRGARRTLKAVDL